RQGAGTLRAARRRPSVEQRLARRRTEDPSPERAARADRTSRGRAVAAVPRHARGSGAAGPYARGVDVGRRPPVDRGLPPSRRARLHARRLQVVDVPVARTLDSVGERKLAWTME